MKLRTVINELACTDWLAARPELVDSDVLLTPEYTASALPGLLFVRLCRLEDYASGAVRVGEGQLLLVHTGAQVPRDLALEGDVVAVAHPSSYSDLRADFLDLPGRIAVLELARERLFEAFVHSYDLAQFARKSSAIIGNPVIIINSDQRLLATAGEFPKDAGDVQEVLSQGYITESVNQDMADDHIMEAVRHARHSVLAYSARYGRHWVTSIIYYHHLEMGRYDVMEKDTRIGGFNLELIDYASQLAGVMIERLGVAGDRVGSGSMILYDLVRGTFADEKTMRAQALLTRLPLDESYVVATLAGATAGANRDYCARVGAILTRTVKNSLWCVADDVLCFMAPIGRSDGVGFDDYGRAARRVTQNKAFTSMLENNDLTAYVSEPFSELAQAPVCFRQCLALARGRGMRGHGRAFLFWENRFAALAAASGAGDGPEMMLDKRVVAMAAYDREHGTSYLETAIMSVRCPGSPAEAAAALNVHRNTYFYRMNKVRELFFLDLKNGDDRLALSFSAQIMSGLGM